MHVSMHIISDLQVFYIALYVSLRFNENLPFDILTSTDYTT